jgi:hypothetical protein
MEQAAMALYIHAARLIKEGKSRKEIKKQLKSQGISDEIADTVLRRISESQANVARRAGYRNLLLGGLITVLAVLLLSGTLTDPATGAGVIVVVLLMAAGILAIGRGLMQIQGW